MSPTKAISDENVECVIELVDESAATRGGARAVDDDDQEIEDSAVLITREHLERLVNWQRHCSGAIPARA